jgi:hypothetical protein
MNLFFPAVKAERGLESTLHLFKKILKRYIRSARCSRIATGTI